jgi:hypothetical protein
MSVALVVGLLAAGGVATSLAEYKLQYNLIDYIVDGFKKLFGYATRLELKAKADAEYVEAEVQKRLRSLQANVKAVEKKL